jgi:hypothetical protein
MGLWTGIFFIGDKCTYKIVCTGMTFKALSGSRRGKIGPEKRKIKSKDLKKYKK